MAKSAVETKASTLSDQLKAVQDVFTEFENTCAVTNDYFDAIRAILDAASVLCALERAPAHHDTHPSHNILTGGGYAYGKRLRKNTLSTLLEHAHCLVDMTDEDIDVCRERFAMILKGEKQ